jgi:GNAT superfamily N-acetyltransferase
MEPMEGIVIRDTLSIGDISAVILFHALYYSACYGWDEEFEAYVALPLAQFVLRRDGRERIWIVEERGTVSGAIALVAVDAGTAQLRWFYLQPHLRGKGIGKELMKRLLAFAVEKRYKTIILWTVSTQKEAIGLYLRNGFVKTEETTHVKWGREITEEKYVLSLR